jgi:hypothetical protein
VKRILLYSPDVVGHPRIYVRVIADALSGQDCELIAAMGFTEAYGLHNSPDLHPLQDRAGVQLLDTRGYSQTGAPHLQAEEIIALQHAFGIDITLFIEADKSNDQFRRIAAGAAPHLRGRNIGIFANTAEWHPGEDSFTGERQAHIGPTLRATLGNLKRTMFHRDRSARHFYENIIIRQGVLDTLLVKDERLADWRGAPVVWMPEISRPPPGPESEEARREYETQSEAIQAYLDAHRDLKPVLYFGDAAHYKGYDLFLEFVDAAPNACAVHAGQSYSDAEKAKLLPETPALREKLLAEGRLFETGAYVSSNQLKQFLFEMVPLYITTHRLMLSSSTMIQAAEWGRPVLMPDRGLVGHRVRTHQLGGTYRYGDIADLVRQANALWSRDLSRFREPVLNFWSNFTDEALRDFFVGLLVGTNDRAKTETT